MLIKAVSARTPAGLRRDPAAARQHAANCSAAAVAALAGLTPLARRGRGSAEGVDQVGVVD